MEEYLGHGSYQNFGSGVITIRFMEPATYLGDSPQYYLDGVNGSGWYANGRMAAEVRVLIIQAQVAKRCITTVRGMVGMALVTTPRLQEVVG